MNVEVWIFAKFDQNIRMFSKIYFCLLFNKCNLSQQRRTKKKQPDQCIKTSV